MPTAPIWIGARLAAVGIAEGLGASMTPVYRAIWRGDTMVRYAEYVSVSTPLKRSIEFHSVFLKLSHRFLVRFKHEFHVRFTPKSGHSALQ
jgi:hypothetical protein